MEIKINDSEAKNALNRLSKKLNNLSPVMRDASIIMKNGVLDNFTEQKNPDGTRWADLSKKYKKYKRKQKGTAYPILEFHGKLKQSINTRSNKNSAMVYTGIKYGVYHQTGTRKMPKRQFMFLSDKYKNQLFRMINDYLTFVGG